jgi:hypothetical protein
MSRVAPFLLMLAVGSGCLTAGPTTGPQGLAMDVAMGGSGPADVAQLCERNACRPTRRVRFELGKGRSVDRDQPPLPYVREGAIFVLPGDDFSVTGDIEGDRLVNLRRVLPGETPPHALSIRFGQAGDRREGPVMMLLLDSKLPLGLAYEASIVPLAGSRHEPTSTCPLRAGQGTREMWPFPIEVLVMRELRLFRPQEHQAACR